MGHSKYISCEYCSVQNTTGAASCLACGAPIDYHRPFSTKKGELKWDTQSKKPHEEDHRIIGEKVEDAYLAALGTYSIAWRTAAEGIAIAVAAFIIGTAGGAAGIGFLGALGGIFVGIAVGLTQKNFYITLVSAPGGAISGLLVGSIFWVFGNPKIFPVIVILFSVFGAIFGGRPKLVFARRNWWEKLRPFLGGLGGLIFAALGSALGWGILSAIQLIQ